LRRTGGDGEREIMKITQAATAILLLLFTILFFVLFSVEKVYPQSAAGSKTGTQSSASQAGTAASQAGKLASGTDRLKLALSDPGYPVTAGDSYILTYISNLGAMTHLISIDNSYKVRVSNLGVVSARGKTYYEFKEQVEKLLTQNFPFGNPQLVLNEPALFKVYVSGEVTRSGNVEVWGLSRITDVIDLAGPLPVLPAEIDTSALSSSSSSGLSYYDLAASGLYSDGLASGGLTAGSLTSPSAAAGSGTAASDGTLPLLTPHSSVRHITVASKDGGRKQYDLFKWEREGDISQNPYVRPGDTVIIRRKARRVSISGAVERAGAYELLEGENLNALISRYGGGLEILADKANIQITRIDGSSDINGDKIFPAAEYPGEDCELRDYDDVFIPFLSARPLVFYIEGAVKANRTDESQITGEKENVSTRFPVAFTAGDTYNSLVLKNRSWFSDVSDVRNSYIIRRGERISIDIARIIFDRDYNQEIPIEKEDTLMIPFKQFFVTVAGAVPLPGRYPFIPDRTWDYYVGLAGGFTEKNSFDAVKIETYDKVKLKKTDFILPETRITAKTNSFLYYFNQYAPIVTTLLSVATTSISLWAILRN